MITQISKLSIITGISLGLALRVAPPAHAQQRTITCESNDNRYKFCRVDTRGGVNLKRQLSDTSCRRGRTWDYDRDGIWVDDGCRAEFVVRGRNNNNNNNNNSSGSTTAAIVGGALIVGAIAAAIASNSDDKNNNSGSTYTVTCSSKDNRYTTCSAKNRGRVTLKRQLSSAGCWQGDTWGYNRNEIWVDNGCRAEFEVRR